jgi:hypothetical protein
MLHTLHIFKKDSRHLWKEILVVTTMIAAFAYLDARSRPIFTAYAFPIDRLDAIFRLLLPLAWWFLIAAVVHEEPIPGDRQFWLTRPYRRGSLLAAKVLFVLVFLNLPMLLADCAILAAHGFKAWSYLPGLLFCQLLLLLVWFLPFVALAAVTENVKQFLLLLAMIPVLYFITTFVGRLPVFYLYWFRGEWIPNSAMIVVVVVGTFLILRIQYLHRRTTLARGIAICAVPLALMFPSFFPRPTAYAAQLALTRGQAVPPSVVLGLDLTRRGGQDRNNLVTDGEPGALELDFPLRATGIPQDLDLVADHLAVKVRTPDGKSLSTAGRSLMFSDRHGQLWMKIHVDERAFQKLRGTRVTVRTSAYLTLLGNSRLENSRATLIPAGAKSVEVPGIGRCSFVHDNTNEWVLFCQAPFRQPVDFCKAILVENEIRRFNEALPIGGSYSPYPAELEVSPLVLTFNGAYGISGPIRGALMLTAAPLSHFHTDFELPDVSLKDFLLDKQILDSQF